ncbi:MAG: hypothetical protein CBARDMAM_0970 [uncultured Caballeronia sp.]|nr:MAG: hypothetical protein CBARDMAM_0970 [uncultured Caballeronia sp.]
MRFQYKHFVIDAMPDFSLGEFWTYVRIAPGTLNEAEAPQPVVINELDIGSFSQESAAVEHAISWARDWIDRQVTVLR